MPSNFLLSDDNLFAFNLKYLSYVGLWPREEWSKRKSFYYKIYEITLHMSSIIYLILTGIGTYQHRDDTALFLSNLDLSLVVYNFFFKVIMFVTKRKRLSILITEIQYSGDKVKKEHKKLMATHVIFITTITTAIVGAFSALALFRGEMTLEAWMPFDPMQNTMNLLLATQILAVIFIPGLYRSVAMQGIACSLIIYICEQLVELQQRLRSLRYSRENEAAMREEFKEIVRKHVRLMGYCKSMNFVFKEFFLIQNLAVTVELCLNAMMVTVVGLQQKKLLASFIAFLAVALLNAYIYCYLGNQMIIESQGISLAAYEALWTNWPIDMQKNLLKVIRTAQNPLKLSAGGIATMSIQTYGQALYNGYSIFAVLNDVID